MVRFLIAILPPIVFFFLVRFMRKNVTEPRIAKWWYWVSLVMFVPILGLILTLIVIVVFIVGVISKRITFDDDTKFYKKWIEK